jgi:hypothetical protein
MHGDSYRQRLLKERGTDAIDGRSRAGKHAKAWRALAVAKKGGKACPIDVAELIDAATFYLWRALCLRAYIVADVRKRGTPINRRTGRLPKVHEQYDTTMGQFVHLTELLELDKSHGLDLARRIQLERIQREGAAK